MIDLYAIGRQRPSGAMTWTTIDIQGTVGNTALGANPLHGLAYHPAKRLFYTISPNSPGGPQLCSLTTAGALQTVRGVAANLTGGLVYRTRDDSFYAISNGPGGDATIHRVPLSGQDSPMFLIETQCTVHGLAYVRQTDVFYALITKNDFTWLYSINLNGTVTRLFGAGVRVFGGLCHSPSEDLFYFVANEPDGFSRLWTLALNGSVVNRMGLGFDFNNAAISVSPWFGGSLNVLSPLEGERFVVGEQVRLDANVLGLGGQVMWNSDGVTWTSDRDGPLGTGTPTVTLTQGAHVITATVQRLRRTVNVRVFTDLWSLYQARPAQAELDRILRDFTIEWVDGDPGDPAQSWATYPGTPFDQTSANPSRTAVLAKLDVLRHQRFAQPLPFTPAESLYDHIRQTTRTIRVSLKPGQWRRHPPRPGLHTVVERRVPTEHRHAVHPPVVPVRPRRQAQRTRRARPHVLRHVLDRRTGNTERHGLGVRSRQWLRPRRRLPHVGVQARPLRPAVHAHRREGHRDVPQGPVLHAPHEHEHRVAGATQRTLERLTGALRRQRV